MKTMYPEKNNTTRIGTKINATNECKQSMQPINATNRCKPSTQQKKIYISFWSKNQYNQSMQTINATNQCNKSMQTIYPENKYTSRFRLKINATNQCKQSMQPINATNQCNECIPADKFLQITFSTKKKTIIPKIMRNNEQSKQ